MSLHIQNRSALLALITKRRARSHASIRVYNDVRDFLIALNNLPKTHRFGRGELEAAAVQAFGNFIGRALTIDPLRSQSFAALQAMLTQPRPEDDPGFVPDASFEFEATPEPEPFEPHRITGATQRSFRESFAEMLEDREGVCNPRRLYRQWLKVEMGPRYIPHTRVSRDAITRLGPVAGRYVLDTKQTTRRALATYLRSI